MYFLVVLEFYLQNLYAYNLYKNQNRRKTSSHIHINPTKINESKYHISTSKYHLKQVKLPKYKNNGNDPHAPAKFLNKLVQIFDTSYLQYAYPLHNTMARILAMDNVTMNENQTTFKLNLDSNIKINYMRKLQTHIENALSSTTSSTLMYWYQVR